MTSILKLLPPSLKQDPFVVALAEAFEIQMLQLREEFEEVCNFVDLTTSNELLIDFLAYEKHVDFYGNLTVEEKRNAVRNSIEIHRKKGTKHALLRVLDLLNLSGEISEWFNYGGAPYYFKIDIDISKRGFTENQAVWLEELLNEYKNARSWVERIRLRLNADTKLHLAGNFSGGEKLTMYPKVQRKAEQKNIVSRVSVVHDGESVTVRPALKSQINNQHKACVAATITSGEEIKVQPYELKNISMRHVFSFCAGVFCAEQTVVYPVFKEQVHVSPENFVGTQTYSAEKMAAYPLM